MAKLSKEKYLILLVDDSADDCLLIKMAVAEADRLRFIGCVSNGDELMAYLQGAGDYGDRIKFPIPDLLLLDLIMPGKSGFEVLEWLKSQPFKDMVVVVLSGSENRADVQQALDMGADYFQHKNAQQPLELVKLLEQFLTRRS